MSKYKFLYLNQNHSGGNEVFNRLVDYSKNAEKLYILDNKNINNYFSNLIKLSFSIIKLRISKNKKILIASDPFLCICMSLIGLKYIRFVQAIDELILLNRVNPFMLFIFKKFYYATLDNEFICNSKYVSDWLNNNHKKKSKKIINPGTDFIYNNKKKIFDIIFILRKAPWKNSNFLLNILKSKRFPKGKNLLLINYDNLELDEFNHKNIKILNAQSYLEMINLFSLSKFYVSATFSEGFGLPALESMACRCIPILPFDGGHNDFAINGKNAFFYDLSYEDNLIKTINYSLSLKLSDLKKLQDHCQKTSRKFTWNKFCNDFYNYIENEF